MRTLFFLLCIFNGWHIGFSQDEQVHFSQLQLVSMHLNPAFTGMEPYDVKATLAYRHQWRTVPVGYESMMGALESTFGTHASGNSQWGVGLSLLQDQAGDASLAYTHVGIQSSFFQSLGSNWKLSVGISGSIVQRSFQSGKFRFGSQYDLESLRYNQRLQSGEEFDSDRVRFGDLGTGIALHANTKDGGYWRFGWAAHHLNQPAVHFNAKDELPWKIHHRWIWMGNLPVSSTWKLRAVVMHTHQGNRHENVLGAGVLYTPSLQMARSMAWGVWMRWRIDDAIIPGVQLHVDRWIVGVSYDINYSDFTIASQGKGGPELVLIYRYALVRVDDKAGFCPIY